MAASVIASPRVLKMAREEGVDDGGVSCASGVVSVPVVGVETLVLRADAFEQRVPRFRWTHVVLEADVYDYRALDAVREADPVEVGERLLHVGAALRVEAQIVVDLLVRVGMRELDRVDETAEVRRPG